VPGISYDGGYGEYMVAPQEALVPIPGTLDAAEAAPLLCAGITTFDALRRSGACAGDLVAVLGVGGLGHLAIQFAARLGYQVVAIGRGAEPAARARKLGAGLYLDGTATDAEATLQRMGGARVVLATAPDARAMSALVGGLQPNGRLVVIGVTSEPLTVAPSQLIPGSCAIQGYVSGTPADSADTLRFAQQHGVRPLIETYPLEQAPEAYARMLSGKAEFRVVLTTGSEEPGKLAP
jgi:D-arabinose 1-dehydrogenase-like Zn-dependent alcohol dehydrogenase